MSRAFNVPSLSVVPLVAWLTDVFHFFVSMKIKIIVHPNAWNMIQAVWEKFADL